MCWKAVLSMVFQVSLSFGFDVKLEKVPMSCEVSYMFTQKDIGINTYSVPAVGGSVDSTITHSKTSQVISGWCIWSLNAWWVPPTTFFHYILFRTRSSIPVGTTSIAQSLTRPSSCIEASFSPRAHNLAQKSCQAWGIDVGAVARSRGTLGLTYRTIVGFMGN